MWPRPPCRPPPGERRPPSPSPAWSPTPAAPNSSTGRASALSLTALAPSPRCPKQFYGPAAPPPPRRSSAAARLGTEIHRWIEQRAGRQLTLIEPDPEAGDDLDPDAIPAGANVAAELRASF